MPLESYKSQETPASDVTFPKTGAAIMFVSGDLVLLGKRCEGGYENHWAFPGGKAEGGETLEETANREAQEEIGYAPTSYLRKIDSTNTDGFQFTTFLSEGNKFDVVRNDEHSEFGWFKMTDLPSPLHPKVKDTLEKFMTQQPSFDAMLTGQTARDYDMNGWPEIKGNPISKVGVFPYLGKQIDASLDPNAVYMVYRPEEELSSIDTINSFKLLPWVNEHPNKLLGPEETGRMPAEKKGIQGVIGQEVYYDDGMLYGNIKLFSDDLGYLINSGEKVELSAGYGCVYEICSGIWNGIRYDVIQRNIRGNHLASVPQGRMGPDVAVLDHLVFTFDAKDIKMPDTKEKDGDQQDKKEGMNFDEVTAALKEYGPKIAKMQDMIDKHFGSKDAKAADEEPKDEPKGKTEPDPDNKKVDTGDADEDKKDDKKDSGMDASIKELKSQVQSLIKNGSKSILADISKRNKLHVQLMPFTGSFACDEMTSAEVAEYGVKKLGLQCAAGQEEAILAGYLHNRKAPSAEIGFALDAGSTSSSSISPVQDFYSKSA